MHILILAGGGGMRLWPLSRQDFPKQFLHFGDQESLLQKTVARFIDSPLTKSISIVTNHQYESLVKQQLQVIDPQQKTQILIEPERRNTGPAIAYAVKQMPIKDSDPLLILPSDHLIEPQAVFSQYLELIDPIVRDHRLVLFGIRPTKAETGYGYIQIGKKFNPFLHQVKQFVEKPDRAKAEQYLQSGEYYWNSGMFALTPHLLWNLLATHAPEIHPDRTPFDQMPDISFDCAVVEKATDILICPLPVSWSDVGSWDSVYEVFEKDQNQNVKFGNVLDIDTKNSLIVGGKRLISTVGLEDLLIIETDDAMFVGKKGESQKVKNIVQELKKIGRIEEARHTTQQFPWGTIQRLDAHPTYELQKIEIAPGFDWEVDGGVLTPLEGEVHILGRGEPLPLFSSLTINEPCKLINASQIGARLLLLRF